MTHTSDEVARLYASGGPGLRTDEAHAARMYDYLLGGTDNFPADRAAADAALAAFPTLRTAARENRAFLGRAVRHVVEETGIRQFLDIGSGLPTAQNVHQVARRHAPGARVAYVDNDPLVLAHGHALLSADPDAAVLEGDIRDPRAIVGHPGTRALIDFAEPVAVLAVAVLHFVPDEEDPGGLVARLRESLVPGSVLVLSHATAEISPETALGVQAAYRAQGVPLTLRDRAEFAALFEGFALVEPGVQVVSDWRPAVPESARPSHAAVSWYGGMGRLG